MKRYTLLLTLLIAFSGISQEITGLELLEKAIAYHDPTGQWTAFNGILNVTTKTPNNPNRDSHIEIDLSRDHFYLKTSRDTTVTSYIVGRGNCVIPKADVKRIAQQTQKPRRSHCEMAMLYKNYYTYLYGLPMKLKDPGTHIDPNVTRTTFKGKEYLVLKATYNENVGSDVWFFYFDPQTYAMEVYQFFKGEPNGDGKNTGEYILLSGEETVNGIKMPKVRAWYYNKGDVYLGTDILKTN